MIMRETCLMCLINVACRYTHHFIRTILQEQAKNNMRLKFYCVKVKKRRENVSALIEVIICS